MARRGLRKPLQRRSLRPRTSAAPAAAETLTDEATQPARASQAPRLVPGTRASAQSARPAQATAAQAAPAPAPHEHELAALEHATQADEVQLTRSFFSQPPAESTADDWDSSAAGVGMAPGTRRAMYAALSIFAGSLVLLIGYLVYQRLVMPVPAQLGTSSGMPAAVAITPPVEQAALPPAVPVRPMPAPAAVAAAQPLATAPVLAVPVAEQPAATAAPAPAAEPAVAATAPAAVPVADEAVPSAPEVAPSAPAAADPHVAELLQAAHALYDRKQRKQAQAAYEEVLAVQPTNPEALSKLGYLELQAGDDARAKDYAQRAVAVDPTSSEGWIVLGAALESLHDRAGAREAYTKCAALGTGPYAHECKRLAR